jgi:S1-C subfamily serine protease
MKQVLVIVGMLAFVHASHADSIKTISIAADELPRVMKGLEVQSEEPIGLVAPDKLPELGLAAGDVIRSINGDPPRQEAFGLFQSSRPVPSVLYMDVRRGKQSLTIRLAVKHKRDQQGKLDRGEFGQMIDRIKEMPARVFGFRAITKNGNPSGVVIDMTFGVLSGTDLARGDIIRRIDHKAITSPEELLAAIQRARGNAQIVIEFERAGQPITKTFTFEGKEFAEALADEIAKITKIDDHTYELTRELIGLAVNDHSAALRGARVVPATAAENSKGLKLQGVERDSPLSKLGLRSGDIVTSINGHDLTTTYEVFEATLGLRHEDKVKVVVIRGGKSLTLQYRIKPT